MKKILFTQVHPAPYIDKWLYEMEKFFSLDVLYNKEKSKEKSWKGFNGYKGSLYKDVTFFQLVKKVWKADLCFVSGWTNKDCFKTIMLGMLFHKKVGIFTDFPFHQNKYADIFKKIFLYRFVNYIFCATQSTCLYIEKKYGNAAKGKTMFFPYAIEMQPAKCKQILTGGGKNSCCE